MMSWESFFVKLRGVKTKNIFLNKQLPLNENEIILMKN